jgi:aminomethyltransferase
MTVIEGVHENHGATFTERGGRRVVAHYGRPARSHRAVRNVVGVMEKTYGVLVVEGEDRVKYVDNAVSNRVPDTDGEGCYALLCSPQGRVETDMYVYNAAAGDRLLVFLPPSEAGEVASEWQDKTFIQDVEIREATAEFGVFGVYGPSATEKVAGVLNEAATPQSPLSFVRGSMDSVGVSVIRDDGLVGEEGYEVVCAADEAAHVYDTLVNRGMAATPFGRETWASLTLEAGTPLFEQDIEGQIPNDLGLRDALDFEKGCYVGQEVVSRIENRGHPGSRLVGLKTEQVADAGAAVFAGDAGVGEVTRGIESPSMDVPIAFAVVGFDAVDGTDEADDAAGDEAVALTVRVDGEEVSADPTPLPFVEGSADSTRRPRYPE